MTAAPPPWRVFDAPPEPGLPPGQVAGTPLAAGADGGVKPDPRHAASPRIPTPSLRLRADVAAGLGAAVGGLALAWLLATGGSIGGSSVDGISVDGGARLTASDDPALALGGGEVVVDVAGAVLRPGVYHLPAGSRVGDAIRAAGGFGPRVAAGEVDRELNLAAIVHDGERVLVPSRDDRTEVVPSAPGSPGRSGGLIDLNTASESELDTLPGIGPVTASKIVASRAEQPFRAVEDLLERKLVGQKTFDSIKALVTVG